MTVSIGLKRSHDTAMTSRMSVADVMLFMLTTQQQERQLMFENVINEEAIEALSEDSIDELLAMFEKAGY
jgi:predicted transcriptional regulator